MTKSKNYIGIDISKLTFDIAIKNEKDNYSHFKFSNDYNGFILFLELLDQQKDVCVMEASGPYYLRLATFLYEHNIGVSVVNPLIIRRFSQMRMMRAKTDKKDSVIIAEYGKTEEPKLWEPDKEYVLELRQMQAYVEQMNKSRTNFMRQREAFKQNTVESTLVNNSMQIMIESLEKEISTIEAKMELIVNEHHQKLFEQIKSIPGLGKKTTMQLIVISGGFTKFENAKQLSSYVGLSPRIFESGTSVKGKTKICKMGMSRIRAMLYVCAWTAKKCNKACKELYDRLVDKGKPKKVALIAVTNKLLKQALAIAKSNSCYSENNSISTCL